MIKKPKIVRSAAEEKKHYKGVIRDKNKRIKILEREVSRLSKYLVREGFEYKWDEEENQVASPNQGPDWECVKCEHNECYEFELPQGSSIRKYFTCKNCGNRTRAVIDGKVMDPSGE